MPGVRARYWNAGHLLGSASIELEFAGEGASGQPLRLLASGDIGPDAKLLQPDPEAPSGFDYVHFGINLWRSDPRSDHPTTAPPATRRQRSTMPRQPRRPAYSSIRGRTHPGTNRRSGRPDGTRRNPHRTNFSRFPTGDPRDRGVSKARCESRSRYRCQPPAQFAASPVHGNRGREQVDCETHGLPHHHRRQRHVRRRPYPASSQALAYGTAGRRCCWWAFRPNGTLGRFLQDGTKAVRIQGDEIKVAARIRMIDDYSGHADGSELATMDRSTPPHPKRRFSGAWRGASNRRAGRAHCRTGYSNRHAVSAGSG